MAPKRTASAPSGQRAISTFFAAKPTAGKGGKENASASAKPAASSARRSPAPAVVNGTATGDCNEGENDGASAPARQTRSTTASPAVAKQKPPAEASTPKPGSARRSAGKAAAARRSPSSAAAAAGAKAGKVTATAPTAAAVSKPGGPTTEDLEGRRVRVWWPAESEWYEGTVGGRSGRKHSVEYDDGDTELVDLSREKFELLEGGAKARAAKSQSSKRKLVSESEDESGARDAADGDSEVSGSEFGSADAGASADSDDSMADFLDDDDDDFGAGGKKPSQQNGAKPAAKRKVSSGKPPTASKKARTTATPGPQSAAAAAAARRVSAHTPAAPPGAKAALTSAFDKGTPVTATPAASTPGCLATPMAEEAERFAARSGERFPFLDPGRIKDAAGKRPGEPGYNQRTLHIPPSWYKDHKISPGQQQWWEMKARNFDSVLLFKMGKFYEMFEMDAYVGVEVLGLMLMKGEQPHAGFPEANYHTHAERLARAGLRVVVVEQTETPAQLAVRNEERKKQRLPKSTVVNRELVAVLTRGTLTDAEMLQSTPDAAYLLAITEGPLPAGSRAPNGSIDAEPVMIGVCAVDAATGQMLLGQWTDGDLRAKLRAHLAALQPVELVVPSGQLSATTWKVLRAVLRSPRVNELAPDREFWDAPQLLQELRRSSYYSAGDDADASPSAYPPALQALLAEEGGSRAPQVLSALGGATFYLRQVLLDRAVLPLGRMELLPDCEGAAGTDGDGGSPDGADAGPEFVRMDASALENLEVLENSTGGTQGTLLAAVDNCATPAGRRLLRQWLVRPLGRVAAIEARQDAVAALMGPAAEAAARARKHFASVLDLERALARLRAAGAGATARDAAHVVLYEDAAKRRVGALVAALRGLRTIQAAMQEFDGEQHNSDLLASLVTPGRRFPDMAAALADLEAATDWEEAEANGRVIPRQGINEDYDKAEQDIAAADRELKAYLKEVRGELDAGKEVCFVPLHKETHVIEVPEELSSRVPRDFELLGQRKGFKRFMSPTLRRAVVSRQAALDAREAALSGSLQAMLRLFSEQHALWHRAVAAVAHLDALMSLAAAAAFADGPMCRPEFIQPGDRADAAPAFHATALRHPAAAELHTTSFVPNDVRLGGDGAAPFIVLTGPNMGGKSTLLRQTCLAALLAHVGAWVPAESLRLSPVDALFVRMGARDNIFGGQSTFLLELSETAALLNSATRHSLVALDELGRGTSTSDGAAIAGAVLDHLTSTVGCRGLFATHYHRLADEHAADVAVSIRHMGCAVEAGGADGMPETVTFLYTLADGACPKSYGLNVARLAGVPESVLRRADVFAKRIEAEHNHRMVVRGGGAAPGLSRCQMAALQQLALALKTNAQEERGTTSLVGVWREVQTAA